MPNVIDQRAWASRGRDICVVLLLALAGCGGAPQPSAASSPAPLERLTPKQVVDRLIALHAARDYAGIERWVLPERRASLIESLQALHDFLATNEALCQHARDRLPLGTAETIDLTRLARNMDIFSPYVSVLAESIEGDTARVTFQVDGGFPLRHATLRRRDDRWRYDPGAGFDESLPRAFREMAAGLRQVLDDLKAGRIAEADVRRDVSVLVAAIEQRLEPALARLRAHPGPRPASLPTAP